MSIELYDKQAFQINNIVFEIDGKPHTFVASSPTKDLLARNSNIIESSQDFNLTKDFFYSFNKAENISLKVQTDKGSLLNDVLTSNKESPAYILFKRGFNQKLYPN